MDTNTKKLCGHSADGDISILDALHQVYGQILLITPVGETQRVNERSILPSVRVHWRNVLWL